VSTRKRWRSIYSEENPFALPQAVLRGLNQCCRHAQKTGNEKVEYLWVHLPGKPGGGIDDSKPPLSLDEWLCIIDESASIGAKMVIVSVGAPLHELPQLLAICEWAQNGHGMIVGIHAYVRLEDPDEEVLRRLDPAKTRVFADSDVIESVRFVERIGIPLYCADGLDDNVVSPRCELPSTMTCVGHEGTLYTCGLVLGKEQYSLGNFFEHKLAHVMDDESLPHDIPEGVSDAKHRCNGCPPLMALKMQGHSH